MNNKTRPQTLTLLELASILIFVLSIVFMAILFFTDFGIQPVRTTNLLESQGYLNIKLTGYKIFACSKGDIFSSGFIAFKDGKQIEGTVCSGLFKGATIRFKY